ncbi:hypothetical protein BASA81_001376 [Batrachochytrium salamandrivorans]|nr:hypothetical protein BASA81_001376 [Batrachochytrium salamandrivorans]
MNRSRNLHSSADNYLPLTDPGNRLGCALLDFLSRSSAVLTEIARLAENIPVTITSANPGFLFTFEEYFQNPEVQDMRINLAPRIAALDLAFSRSQARFLERFYLVCVGIARLGEGFNVLMRDLQRGFYVSHTLEQVLLDVDGKQWLPECLHLLATTVLFLDFKFSCRQRQHLLVAYYRANRTLVREEFDTVLNLLQPIKDQGSNSGGGGEAGIVVNPKELLLSRFQINPTVLSKIHTRIRGDDLYHHVRAWPSSEHRSTALSKQSSLLFTSLLFCESNLTLLAQAKAEMREIVDRFFPDCWVVSICNGFVVDLAAEWYLFYPAAKQALERTLAKQPALCSSNDLYLAQCQANIDDLLLRAGVLTEKYVLSNWEFLLGVIRDTNVTLRWRMQHRAKVEVGKSIRLLLSVSRLEEIVKLSVSKILETKPQTFALHQLQVGNRMLELAEYFAKSNPEVSKWFATLEHHIKNLEYAKVQLDGRRILQLVRSIEEVERIDALEDASLQVKEFLLECKLLLENILAVLNVKEEILVQIEVVSDFSLDYVRELDLSFWEGQFKQDPHSVALLSSLFAKLRTCLDQTLYRIVQNPASHDCPSVADYWGRKICQFLQTRVLAAVPKLVFQELDLLPSTGLMDSSESRYELSLTMFKIALWAGNLPPKLEIGTVEFDPEREFFLGLQREVVQRLNAIMALPSHRSSSSTGTGDWRKELERRFHLVALVQTNLETLQDYFRGDSLTGMFVQARNELVDYHAYAKYLVHECLMSKVDWFNEADFPLVVKRLEGVFGKRGVLEICSALYREIYSVFTGEFQTLQTLALAQLDLPTGVAWGSAEWVDSVREARRKYIGADVDFKSLKRAGMALVVVRKIEFIGHVDRTTELPELASTLLCPKRAFVLMNELAKRMCQVHLTSTVFGNPDYYFAVCGVGFLCHRNQAFAQELARMANLSAKALCHKSYSERKSADNSLVFKYGKQKVAKVAMERLVAEQSIHQTIAFMGSSASKTTAMMAGESSNLAGMMNYGWAV